MMSKTKKLLLVNAPIDTRYQDSTSIFYPPSGLLSIKAYIELHNEESDVLLLDGMIYKQDDIIRQMEKYKPDMVGVSIQLLSYQNAVRICRIAKTLGAITFMGGHHATHMYKNILQNKNKWVDYII